MNRHLNAFYDEIYRQYKGYFNIVESDHGKMEQLATN